MAPPAPGPPGPIRGLFLYVVWAWVPAILLYLAHYWWWLLPYGRAHASLFAFFPTPAAGAFAAGVAAYVAIQ